MKSKNKNLCLMLIDMSPELLQFYDKDKEEIPLLTKQIYLLKYCKTNNIPIIIIEPEKQETDISINYFTSSLNQNYIKYLKKEENNSFSNPELLRQLNYWKIQNILLGGIYTSICIHDTCQSAIKNGFNVLSSQDIVKDRNILPEYNRKKRVEWINQNIKLYDTYHQLLTQLQNSY
jgi:isochorismate hydrolase